VLGTFLYQNGLRSLIRGYNGILKERAIPLLIPSPSPFHRSLRGARFLWELLGFYGMNRLVGRFPTIRTVLCGRVGL